MHLRASPFITSVSALIGLAACSADPTEPGGATVSTGLADEEPGFIEDVDYDGDGCPPGTVQTGLSEDRQSVTSNFAELYASAGPGLPDELRTRHCVSVIRVNVPEGWSYTVETTRHWGWVQLEEGGAADREAKYQIADGRERAATTSWSGPVNEFFNPEDIGAEDPLEWSPCGGGQRFRIVTKLAAHVGEDPSRQADLTINNIDTRLMWRRCP
jgi:hypothetical protein